MRRWRNEVGVSDYSPPGHHRKGSGRKGNRSDAGLRSRGQGQQDGDQAGGTEHFQGESGLGAHCQLRRQGAPSRQICWISPRLEEGVCAAEGGREDARIRGEFVSARLGRATAGARQGTSRDMAIKTYRPVTPTRRFTTTTVNDDLTTNRPHKPLTEPKQRS